MKKIEICGKCRNFASIHPDTSKQKALKGVRLCSASRKGNIYTPEACQAPGEFVSSNAGVIVARLSHPN